MGSVVICREHRLAVVASTGAMTVGQVIMLALTPLSRASGTFATSSGVAIIAPDSSYYLRPSGLSEVLALPWTRWGYPLLLQLNLGIIDRAAVGVLVNALALVIAGALLFHVTRQIGGTVAAAAALAVLSVNPMTAQWVRIVMTESVFFATVAIACSLSIRLLSLHPRRTDAMALLLVAMFAATTRPNGFLVTFSALIVLVLASVRSLRLRIAAGVLLAVFIVPAGLLAHAASGPPAEGSLTSQLYAGVVIEGTDHVRTTIRMPAPRDVRDESLGAGARYALDHPLATLRLGSTRLAAETLQVRRHYPGIVNLGFGIGILVLLVAVATGWRDERSRTPRRVFLVMGLPLMLLTMATFAVPESRYGWAYLIASSPLAGIGVARVSERRARAQMRSTDRVEAGTPDPVEGDR